MNVRRFVTMTGLVLAFFACLAALPAHADSFANLGVAGNYGVLGINGGNIVLSAVTVHGNVGDVQGGTISNMAPSSITGNVDIFTSSQYSGPGSLGGSKNINAALMGSSGSVQTAVNNAISTIGGYTNWQNVSVATNANNVFNAGGTLTELRINGDINLNNFNITLNGGATQYIVVNVTGNLALTGTASLLLSGGITPDHVIYYFNNAGCTFNTHVGDTVSGIMLGPSCAMTLDGTWNGELISGDGISLLSNANVNQPTTTTPEPGSLALLGTGLLALGGLVRRSR